MLNNDLKFEEISFIGGGTQKMLFEVYDRDGELLILTGSTIKWSLTTINNKSNPIIKKDNKEIGGIRVLGAGAFEVELYPQDTANLQDGKYEQEPIIIQPTGKVLRPNYGYIQIKRGSVY